MRLTKLPPLKTNLPTREIAQQIADTTLELRNLAKAQGFTTLTDLLEISFCEAFAIANKVEISREELNRLKHIKTAQKAFTEHPQPVKAAPHNSRKKI